MGSEVQVLPGPPVLPLPTRFALVPFPPSIQGDIAQLVEHLLCKQGVTGSNPVVSIIPGPCSRSECEGIIPRMAVARSDTAFLGSSIPHGCVDLDRIGTARSETSSSGCRPETWSEATPVPNCIARKGHEIVAALFFNKNSLAHVNRRSIDDFVLCQGESGSGASLGACDGSGTVCRVRPVVRLMSDRESASDASKPPLGFAVQVHAPKSDSEGSEALCVLIRILSCSPQGMGTIRGPCLK